MRAQEFLDLIESEGTVAALSSYSEEELADIDEPPIAASALAAKWAVDHLLNLAEDFGVSRHVVKS